MSTNRVEKLPRSLAEIEFGVFSFVFLNGTQAVICVSSMFLLLECVFSLSVSDNKSGADRPLANWLSLYEGHSIAENGG